MGNRRSSLACAALALVAALGPGCYSSGGQGAPPIDSELYFPVGLGVTTPNSKYLFVANSDFDLAYNAGTVQAYYLGTLGKKQIGDPTHDPSVDNGIEHAVRQCEEILTNGDPAHPTPECVGYPAGSGKDPVKCQQTLSDAGCLGAPATPYLGASVRIGAFASDLTIVPLHDAKGNTVTHTTPVPAGTPPFHDGRVLVTVRGDATLTYIDYVEPDAGGIVLDCYTGAKAGDQGHDCATDHRVGQDPNANARQLTLEGEPFAVATPIYWNPTQEPAQSGGIAAIAHQTTGDVSVFRDVAIDGRTPKLAYTLTGLPVDADAIAALDVPPTGSASFVPRFLVANRTAPTLALVSYLGDSGNLDRSVLVESSLVPITTQTTGYDTRGILVDPPNPGENRPTRVFLSSRSPASLVIGQIEPDSGALHFYENAPLPIGPSRITRGTYTTSDGVTHTRVYVVSYDSAYVIAYDPDTRRLGDVVHVGRGPYAISIDSVRKLGYVANFVDNTIQVFELDPTRGTALFEQVVLTVGVPHGPTQ
jgi:hypothetical protein